MLCLVLRAQHQDSLAREIVLKTAVSSISALLSSGSLG